MAVADPPRKEVAHDETPAIIGDHAFIPRGEWWTLCKICGLAQAAHASTTLTGREHIAYYSDDNPDDDE
jgi:hypothetical protein